VHQDARYLPTVGVTASLANHSCEPTAAVDGVWDAKAGAVVLRIYSLTDIPEGASCVVECGCGCARRRTHARSGSGSVWGQPWLTPHLSLCPPRPRARRRFHPIPRPHPAGGEVTISYTPPRLPRDMRVTQLAGRYGFTCACRRCAAREWRTE
jgi:hypothetical protein